MAILYDFSKILKFPSISPTVEFFLRHEDFYSRSPVIIKIFLDLMQSEKLIR